jgi:hypothetical protein
MLNDTWRVGHRGRDAMYYEELVDGEWLRLDLDGEMNIGRAHHVIYFGSKEKWRLGPEWTHSRRTEIIARIKSAFRIPDYEYEGEAVLDEKDRQSLIAAAGGLSANHCCWAGCAQNALAEKLVCVYHAYPGHHDRNPAGE